MVRRAPMPSHCMCPLSERTQSTQRVLCMGTHDVQWAPSKVAARCLFGIHLQAGVGMHQPSLRRATNGPWGASRRGQRICLGGRGRIGGWSQLIAVWWSCHGTIVTAPASNTQTYRRRDTGLTARGANRTFITTGPGPSNTSTRAYRIRSWPIKPQMPHNPGSNTSKRNSTSLSLPRRRIIHSD